MIFVTLFASLANGPFLKVAPPSLSFFRSRSSKLQVITFPMPGYL